MYEDEFQRIMDSSRKNTLTIFVGAGVSRMSKAPSWKNLIDDFCGALKRNKNVSTDEYLKIPQIYYYSIGRDEDRYYSFICERFKCNKLKPNVIHKMLFELKPCSFVTTNFDDLLEKASIEYCTSYKTVACDEEVSEIYGDRYILKIHGDLAHRNIVLKEEDYLNYSDNFKLIETLLKSIFSTNTVLLIGYGLNDYNIKLILNWAKSLLKDHFNKPIFIYTDDEKLTSEELIYHESRGLSVVEYYKCNGFVERLDSLKYENRYKTVLKAIKVSDENSIKDKDKEGLFNVLFSRLKPLNDMWALKASDIQEKLGQLVIVEQIGMVIQRCKQPNIFERFIEINQMDCSQRNSLPYEELNKYKIIASVLSKGNITSYKTIDKYSHIIKLNDIRYSFADKLCLTFDYLNMDRYISKKHKSIRNNYKKAFYLSKLKRYKEAFEIFGQVATKAFANKNYLLYYLAQTNKYKVYKAMELVRNNDYSKLSDEERMGMSASQVEHLFDNLPHEFQVTYSCFKDLASVNLLYKNSYESRIDNRRLQNIIETDSLEIGITSLDKVVSRLNGNLHFLLGNALYIDEYVEFKNTVKDVMEQLIFKYSIQNKERRSNSAFGDVINQKIMFNYVDFYCFIEYFNPKELSRLLSKYDIKEIEFSELEIICKSIENIINYYEQVIEKSMAQIEKKSYQGKIKTCMILLRYFSIPQKLMDKLCSFILKYDFCDIYIDEKIYFLEYQIVKRNMSSYATSTIIENKLIDCLDKHIETAEKGKDFCIPSHMRNVNYYNLVHYIKPRPSIVRLTKRFNKIFDIGIGNFPIEMFEHCYLYLSDNMKNKTIRNMKRLLNKDFDFKYFTFLVAHDIKIESDLIKKLKLYLDKIIKITDITVEGVTIYPQNDKYEDLVDVGYWCLINVLPAIEFKKYVGYSELFDFYYLYDKFDFSKFDVKWLLGLYEPIIEKICENNYVKSKLRSVVAISVQDKKLNPKDEKKLLKILTHYLC